jgi:hypothetical protein
MLVLTFVTRVIYTEGFLAVLYNLGDNRLEDLFTIIYVLYYIFMYNDMAITI